jgi:hypothetical protein
VELASPGVRALSCREVTQGIRRSSLPRFARPPGSLRLATSAALRFIPGLDARSPSGFKPWVQYDEAHGEEVAVYMCKEL